MLMMDLVNSTCDKEAIKYGRLPTPLLEYCICCSHLNAAMKQLIPLHLTNVHICLNMQQPCQSYLIQSVEKVQHHVA